MVIYQYNSTTFQLEKENAKLQATLKALKEDAMKSFKPRTPKKLTDLTTKLQMKRMVEDLESEIGTCNLYIISGITHFVNIFIKYLIMIPLQGNCT